MTVKTKMVPKFKSKINGGIVVNLATVAVVTALAIHSVPLFAAIVTFEGVVDKVVPEKTEIYVLADGKRHEFYFTDKTEVTQAGQKATFAVLKKAQKVKVTADKVGKRLDPLKVEVLE